MTDDEIFSGLAANGKRLWAAVRLAYDPSPTQLEVLLLACKQSDRAAEARRVLQSEEIVGMDRFGQDKPHPAVEIERKASLACAALLKSIIGDATIEDDETEKAENFFE